MNLLKTSAEVRTLVDENKAARKRIKEIQNIFKKNNSTREQIQAQRDEEKIEKTKLKNNREIIKTINNVQNNVDDLARLNIVHLMCCLYKNNEGAELTR